ncbi:PREDICTED: uncharacterized protein LOC106816453 [Priapulus caudatus]|uniref:Uncharacterized protein LOC106816453 n=1 Tax=Priapulus caudatus TaxID=37621 RepID=A0ABM1EWJ4_PRICU|nr:PREDICTED: uncharacterized protein LOC106816453 [Priapulus caudatus]
MVEEWEREGRGGDDARATRGDVAAEARSPAKDPPVQTGIPVMIDLTVRTSVPAIKELPVMMGSPMKTDMPVVTGVPAVALAPGARRRKMSVAVDAVRIAPRRRNTSSPSVHPRVDRPATTAAPSDADTRDRCSPARAGDARIHDDGLLAAADSVRVHSDEQMLPFHNYLSGGGGGGDDGRLKERLAVASSSSSSSASLCERGESEGGTSAMPFAGYLSGHRTGARGNTSSRDKQKAPPEGEPSEVSPCGDMAAAVSSIPRSPRVAGGSQALCSGGAWMNADVRTPSQRDYEAWPGTAAAAMAGTTAADGSWFDLTQAVDYVNRTADASLSFARCSPAAANTANANADASITFARSSAAAASTATSLIIARSSAAAADTTPAAVKFAAEESRPIVDVETAPEFDLGFDFDDDLTSVLAPPSPSDAKPPVSLAGQPDDAGSVNCNDGGEVSRARSKDGREFELDLGFDLVDDVDSFLEEDDDVVPPSPRQRGFASMVTNASRIIPPSKTASAKSASDRVVAGRSCADVSRSRESATTETASKDHHRDVAVAVSVAIGEGTRVGKGVTVVPDSPRVSPPRHGNARDFCSVMQSPDTPIVPRAKRQRAAALMSPDSPVFPTISRTHQHPTSSTPAAAATAALVAAHATTMPSSAEESPVCVGQGRPCRRRIASSSSSTTDNRQPSWASSSGSTAEFIAEAKPRTSARREINYDQLKPLSCKVRGAANPFIDDAALLDAEADEEPSSDETEASDDDEKLELSFIDDASQLTQAAKNMTGVYLTSVRSPGIGGYKLNYANRRMDVFSQPPRHDDDDEDYENDSFCVGEIHD